MNGETMSSALLSPCGKYRYWLTRDWGHGRRMTFVMLNPSTADADSDDPTIRRCAAFARREQCQGIVVVNLFAYRATDPKELRTAYDLGGDVNRSFVLGCLHDATSHAYPVVCAWGADTFAQRSSVLSILAQHGNLQCLGTTKHGAPRHPLFLRKDAQLEPYSVAVSDV